MVVARYDQVKSEYEESLTYNDFESVVKGGERLDIRGNRTILALNAHGTRRIDRRAVRPADDVVSEDGLALTVDPDQEDTEPQTPVQEIHDDLSDGDEEWIDDDGSDDLF